MNKDLKGLSFVLAYFKSQSLCRTDCEVWMIQENTCGNIL